MTVAAKNVDRLRRIRLSRAFGPLLYFLIIAGAMMLPFAGPTMTDSAGGDQVNHTLAILEASNALKQGQFPLRTSPNAVQGDGVPYFSFYANLPYAAGGLLMRMLHANAYKAYRLDLLIAMALGGWFVCRTVHGLTRKHAAGLIAGTAFVLSPYMFTDAFARSAFAEAISFNLLPIAFYYSLRTFSRGRPGNVLAAGVAWACISLTHNITFLFGGLFVGLFFLSLATPSLKYMRRMARLATAAGVSGLLVLWYLVPQLMVVNRLTIANIDNGPPGSFPASETIRLLFWPVERTGATSTTPHLAMQIGLPMLAGWLGTLVAVVPPRRRRGAGRRLAIALLLAPILPLFIVWNPRPAMWVHLPKVLYHLQFTYRLMMLVTLFGSMTLGLAAAAWLPRRRAIVSNTTSRPLAAASLLAVGLCSATYVWPRHSLGPAVTRQLLHNPANGAGGVNKNYCIRPDVLAPTTPFNEGINYADPDYGLDNDGWVAGTAARTVVAMPPNSSLVRISGVVPPQAGRPVRVNVVWDGKLIATTSASPGPFKLEGTVRTAIGEEPTNVLTISTDWSQPRISFPPADVAGLDPGIDAVSIRLTSVRFAPPIPSPLALMPVDATRPLARRPPHGTHVKLSVDRPTLAQLPVLWYPGLLRVRDNGRDVPYGNVGRFVSVELSPGQHEIVAQFVGNRWANRISGVAWIGVLLLAAWRAWQGLHANVGLLARPGFAYEPCHPETRASLLAHIFAGLGVTLALNELWFGEAIAWHFGWPNMIVTASRSIDDAHGPDKAFDNDPSTAWITGGPDPATLTIEFPKPRELTGLTLTPRRTSLFEAWNAVRVQTWTNDEPTGDAIVQIPYAAHREQDHVSLPAPLQADRILLTFRDAITEKIDGGPPAPPGTLSPGYTEVKLQWATPQR